MITEQAYQIRATTKYDNTIKHDRIRIGLLEEQREYDKTTQQNSANTKNERFNTQRSREKKRKEIIPQGCARKDTLSIPKRKERDETTTIYAMI